MFLYVFGVALHDHVVRFHFEPQGNSIWRYFWKKSRKKWQFLFFKSNFCAENVFYERKVAQNGTKQLNFQNMLWCIIKIHGSLKIATKAKKMLKNEVLSK